VSARKSKGKTSKKASHTNNIPSKEGDTFRQTKIGLSRLDLLICLLLVVATLTVYLQVRNHEFIRFDDDQYIAKNRHIQQGLTTESVTWALTATDISYWQPMTLLSLILDYELYGLNPLGYHLTNLLLHLLNTLLLFLVLKRMTGSIWRSAFVASLFALHPLNVESVAWATERKNVLSTTFWMLTMWTYVLYVERPVIVRYVLVFLCFALGLMSKPMLVTLPFVLLLLDYWPLGRFQFRRSAAEIEAQEHKLLQPSSRWASNFRLVLEKVPLVVLSVVAIYVSSLSVQRSAIVISTETVPMTLRIANALVSYVGYIGKMFWPQKLAIVYPYPTMLPTWQIAGAGLLLIGVTLVAIWTFQRLPYLVTGWLWYLGTLIPVIGLKQVGFWPAMADRFAYVPLIGLFIMIAWGGPELVAGWRHRRVVLSVVAGAAHWRNTAELFKHALEVTTDNYVAHNNFGNELAAQGMFDEAISHYSETLRLKPHYMGTHNNLAVVLARQGRFDEAILHYSEALRLKPDSAETHNNLGVALAKLGKIDAAIAHYIRALELEPHYAEAHNNMGNALAEQGKLDDAVSYFYKALEVSQAYPKAHNNLGVALARQGKFDEAISHFNEALRLQPDFTQARVNLEIAKEEARRSTNTTDFIPKP
jgi:Flp pilus assembly protein TadD